MVVGDFTIELDTVVIGAGPGGYVAAIRSAQLGQKVVIIEKEHIGGVCLNVGCIPSKALISAGHRYQHVMHSETFGITAKEVTLDFSETQAWKEKKVVGTLTKGIEMLLKKNNVKILRGEAFFVDDHQLRVIQENSAQTYSFNHAIIATGSRPNEMKGLEFGERVIDSSAALNLTEVPKKLVVIGGGYIGCELAGAYANFGSEVVILEGGPSILPNFEKDMVKYATDNFKNKNVRIETNAIAKGISETENGVSVTYEVNGEEKSVKANYVLVSVGRQPNTDELGLEVAGITIGERGLIPVDEQGRTNKKNVFAIGDIVSGLALAHKASYEAKVAAEAIAGKNVAVDYGAIPSVCFVDPEMASVGLTLEEAKAKGYNAEAFKFPLSGNGRALSLNATEGFVRFVTTKEDKILIGAQVVGVGASDIIAELALAIEQIISVEDISLTIHSHPSLGETVMDAAELALGMPIHM